MCVSGDHPFQRLTTRRRLWLLSTEAGGRGGQRGGGRNSAVGRHLLYTSAHPLAAWCVPRSHGAPGRGQPPCAHPPAAAAPGAPPFPSSLISPPSSPPFLWVSAPFRPQGSSTSSPQSNCFPNSIASGRQVPSRGRLPSWVEHLAPNPLSAAGIHSETWGRHNEKSKERWGKQRKRGGVVLGTLACRHLLSPPSSFPKPQSSSQRQQKKRSQQGV